MNSREQGSHACGLRRLVHALATRFCLKSKARLGRNSPACSLEPNTWECDLVRIGYRSKGHLVYALSVASCGLNGRTAFSDGGERRVQTFRVPPDNLESNWPRDGFHRCNRTSLATTLGNGPDSCYICASHTSWPHAATWSQRTAMFDDGMQMTVFTKGGGRIFKSPGRVSRAIILSWPQLFCIDRNAIFHETVFQSRYAVGAWRIVTITAITRRSGRGNNNPSRDCCSGELRSLGIWALGARSGCSVGSVPWAMGADGATSNI